MIIDRLKIMARLDGILLERVLKTPNENPKTLEELANYYGVGRERIRQQEARAIERLRHCVEKKGVDYLYTLIGIIDTKGITVIYNPGVKK